MATVYSTREVHPRDRFSYWLEVATKGFVRHAFRSHVGSAFEGRVRLGSLAELGVAAFVCDAAEVSRTAQDIARADSDDLLISHQLSGKAVVVQDGRQAVNERGSFVLLDTRRPFTEVFQTRTKTVVLKVPRQSLQARLGNVAGFTARTMELACCRTPRPHRHKRWRLPKEPRIRPIEPELRSGFSRAMRRRSKRLISSIHALTRSSTAPDCSCDVSDPEQPVRMA